MYRWCPPLCFGHSGGIQLLPQKGIPSAAWTVLQTWPRALYISSQVCPIQRLTKQQMQKENYLLICLLVPNSRCPNISNICPTWRNVLPAQWFCLPAEHQGLDLESSNAVWRNRLSGLSQQQQLLLVHFLFVVLTAHCSPSVSAA